MAKTIEREVIVVGAGPGGSTAAGYLAKEGIDVLLLDKETFPREKPCGDGTCRDSVFHIKQLGAYDEYMKYAESHRGFEFYAADGTLAFVDAPLHTCPRRISDNILRQAAERLGADVIEDCWVYDVIKEGGQIKGVKAKYQGEYVDFRAKVVIGADGAHSKIAKAAGMFFDGDGDELTVAVVARGYMSNIKDIKDVWEFYYDDFITPGYVWIMPYEKYEKGFANIGIGYTRGQYEIAKLGDLMDKWIKSPKHEARFKNAKWVGPLKGWRIPQNYKQNKIHDNGLILIGDAAAQNLPVSGEGVGPAMCAAAYATMAIKEAIKMNDFTKDGGLKLYYDSVQKYMVPTNYLMYQTYEKIKNIDETNKFFREIKNSKEVQEQARFVFTGGTLLDGIPH